MAAEGGINLTGWDLRITSNSIDGIIPEEQCEEDIFLKETSHFLTAVRTGETKSIQSTFDDAFRTQVLVDSIQKLTIANLYNDGIV
jgi:hypothetical protein